MYSVKRRMGAVVPANNSVLEPEFWSRMPTAHALFVTRLLAKGDLTPDAIHKMESGLWAAVEQLEATGVDVLIYADMVTTFVMKADWNERKMSEIGAKIGAPCVSAWTALRDALAAMNIRKIAIGTPYPRAIHALVGPFFEEHGFEVAGGGTLNIVAMRDVPLVEPNQLEAFVDGLRWGDADGIVLLATDLPTFDSIERIEQRTGRPVLTSNQTLLWASLRAAGYPDALAKIGKLGAVGVKAGEEKS